jgi:hypothetical protein
MEIESEGQEEQLYFSHAVLPPAIRRKTIRIRP